MLLRAGGALSLVRLEDPAYPDSGFSSARGNARWLMAWRRFGSRRAGPPAGERRGHEMVVVDVRRGGRSGVVRPGGRTVHRPRAGARRRRLGRETGRILRSGGGRLAARADAFSDPELEFDREAYPVGVSLRKGAAPALIGVTQRLARVVRVRSLFRAHAQGATRASVSVAASSSRGRRAAARASLASPPIRRGSRTRSSGSSSPRSIDTRVPARRLVDPRRGTSRNARSRTRSSSCRRFPIISTSSSPWRGRRIRYSGRRSSRSRAIPPRCATKRSRAGQLRTAACYLLVVDALAGANAGAAAAAKLRRAALRSTRRYDLGRGNSRGFSRDPPSKTPPPRRTRRRRRSERRRRSVAPPPPPRTPPRESADSFDGSRAVRGRTTQRRLRRSTRR